MPWKPVKRKNGWAVINTATGQTKHFYKGKNARFKAIKYMRALYSHYRPKKLESRTRRFIRKHKRAIIGGALAGGLAVGGVAAYKYYKHRTRPRLYSPKLPTGTAFSYKTEKPKPRRGRKPKKVRHVFPIIGAKKSILKSKKRGMKKFDPMNYSYKTKHYRTPRLKRYNEPNSKSTRWFRNTMKDITYKSKGILMKDLKDPDYAKAVRANLMGKPVNLKRPTAADSLRPKYNKPRLQTRGTLGYIHQSVLKKISKRHGRPLSSLSKMRSRRAMGK